MRFAAIAFMAADHPRIIACAVAGAGRSALSVTKKRVSRGTGGTKRAKAWGLFGLHGSVVDFALGVSGREDARRFLATQLAIETASVRSADEGPAFVEVAVALEVGGGRAEVVAALERIRKRSTEVAFALAREIGGDTGMGFVAEFAFSVPDRAHMTRLADTRHFLSRIGDTAIHLGVIRRTSRIPAPRSKRPWKRSSTVRSPRIPPSPRSGS